jgi:hypothetical protein
MKQLTFGEIMDLAHALIAQKGMKISEVRKLPVYIGNDDELNGIHCAWDRGIIDVNNPEDADLVEMINDDFGNHKITDKAILIC